MEAMVSVLGIMLTESIFRLSAVILNFFCRRLDAGFKTGSWALLHRDISAMKMISDIRLKPLNSSEFNSKSQNPPFYCLKVFPSC